MTNNEQMGCLFALMKLLGLVPGKKEAIGVEKPPVANKPPVVEKMPYCRKAYLLTKAERAFFDVLYPIVDKHFHLFAMVRLADLIVVAAGTEKPQSFRNRIQSKHIDFVLCNKIEVKPMLAIELDDSSHERPDRQKRDVFVDAALKEAGLPLLRVKVRGKYDSTILKQKIRAAILDSA